jgi:hypothetical protein
MHAALLPGLLSPLLLLLLLLGAVAAEYYVHGSGVIGVVVYGLYGASSFLYGFSSKGMRQQVTVPKCFLRMRRSIFCLSKSELQHVQPAANQSAIRMPGWVTLWESPP